MTTLWFVVVACPLAFLLGVVLFVKLTCEVAERLLLSALLGDLAPVRDMVRR